jgi:hypothetical protein
MPRGGATEDENMVRVTLVLTEASADRSVRTWCCELAEESGLGVLRHHRMLPPVMGERAREIL